MSCVSVNSNHSSCFSESNINKLIFSNDTDIELGQRLGINYMRSLKEEILIKLDENTELCLKQSNMGLIAISSVVWDAGILMVDFLNTLYQTTNDQNVLQDLLFTQWPPFKRNEEVQNKLGNVLELGAGTGIGGLTCIHLGASSVLFSDITHGELLQNNLEPFLISHPNCRTDFQVYDWEQSFTKVPDNIKFPTKSCDMKWDTVICSDVLYESKLHASFANLLKSIHFHRLILSYKRRNTDPEKKFLNELSAWCDLAVADNDDIDIVNLSKNALSGLFIIIAIKRL